MFGMSSLQAQLNYTFFTGINYSVAEPQIGFDIDRRAGFFAGANIAHKLNDKLTVSLELQYSEKGYGQDDEIVLEEVSYYGNSHWRLTYLDWMPELQFQVVPHFSIGVGMNMGIEIVERQHFESQGDSPELNFKQKSYFHKNIDYGGVVTLRSQFDKLVLLLRFNQGYRAMASYLWTDENGKVSQKGLLNENLQFGIGYRI